jgi:hypothetical protein
MPEDFSAIEKWYADRCDGEWEHSWGVKIETLDNPGWRIRINLNKTPAQLRALPRQKIDRAETDWIYYWVDNATFHAACGPTNLSETFGLFLAWFDSTDRD